MHLYSDNLSTIANISSLIMSEFFPACFSCSNNFNLLRGSLGSDGKNIGEIPETLIAADLSYFIRVLSLVDYLPGASTSKYISIAN